MAKKSLELARIFRVGRGTGNTGIFFLTSQCIWFKVSFSFLNQNIYCGYLKELSKWAVHPKQMLILKLMTRFLHLKNCVHPDLWEPDNFSVLAWQSLRLCHIYNNIYSYSFLEDDTVLRRDLLYRFSFILIYRHPPTLESTPKKMVVISQVKIDKILNLKRWISLNICFGCSKQPSHGDDCFEHPQHMIWLRNKKILILIMQLSSGLGYNHWFYLGFWQAFFLIYHYIWGKMKKFITIRKWDVSIGHNCSCLNHSQYEFI